MQGRTSSNAVFVDLSVLMDYCTVYLEGNRYADQALDTIKQNNGEIIISSHSQKILNQRMANRQRAWEHLEEEASRYLKESENPVIKFRAEVLNFTDIEQAIPYELDVDYLIDIERLRKELNQIGLNEFRKEINRFRIQSKNQRFTLEEYLITDTFSKGGL